MDRSPSLVATSCAYVDAPIRRRSCGKITGNPNLQLANDDDPISARVNIYAVCRHAVVVCTALLGVPRVRKSARTGCDQGSKKKEPCAVHIWSLHARAHQVMASLSPLGIATGWGVCEVGVPSSIGFELLLKSS